MEVHKPMTEGHEQVEEGTTGSGKDERTVEKPTGKAPDTQNVWDVTETVMEERVVEEIPPNTQEQVPQRLSMERREMTGESSKRTGEVRQPEAAEQPPCEVFTLLSSCSLITIELEPDILYIEGVLDDSCDVL